MQFHNIASPFTAVLPTHTLGAANSEKGKGAVACSLEAVRRDVGVNLRQFATLNSDNV